MPTGLQVLEQHCRSGPVALPLIRVGWTPHKLEECHQHVDGRNGCASQCETAVEERAPSSAEGSMTGSGAVERATPRRWNRTEVAAGGVGRSAQSAPRNREEPRPERGPVEYGRDEDRLLWVPRSEGVALASKLGTIR